jgi:hypothetical protein
MITDGRLAPSSSLWMFVSRKGSSLCDQIAFDKHVPIEVKEFFGVSVKGFLLGNKRLKMMEVDHFEGLLEDVMVVVDPAVIECVTAKNQQSGARQWMLEESDARDPGQDGTVGVLTTDFGLRLKNERACAVWTDASII